MLYKHASNPTALIALAMHKAQRTCIQKQPKIHLIQPINCIGHSSVFVIMIMYVQAMLSCNNQKEIIEIDNVFVW